MGMKDKKKTNKNKKLAQTNLELIEKGNYILSFLSVLVWL